MDKIFKNDTIMGLVAIATLVLTVILFLKSRKLSSASCDNPPVGEE